MGAALDRCTASLGNPNVRAFLRVIREGESSQDNSAYTIVNGGGHFEAPPWKHPFYGVPTTQGAKASGAYQFLGTTWARIDELLGLGGDFSPASQDVGAVYLIEGRGALKAVMDGDLVLACSKLAPEWVSLPGLGFERVQRVFQAYGGASGAAPTPPPVAGSQPDVPATPIVLQPEQQPMPAILATLLPTVLQMFAPRAQAALGKITGQPADVLNPFLQQLFAQIGQVTNVGPVTNDAQAIAAVAELQKLKDANSALVAQVENHALDYLDKLAPLFDRLAAADTAENDAKIKGADAAMVRQQSADPAMVRLVVGNINGQSWMVLGGLVIALAASAVAKGYWPDMPDYFTVVLALAGPLFGQVMKERGAVIAYYFDGNPASNTANAINQQIVQASAKR